MTTQPIAGQTFSRVSTGGVATPCSKRCERRHNRAIRPRRKRTTARGLCPGQDLGSPVLRSHARLAGPRPAAPEPTQWADTSSSETSSRTHQISTRSRSRHLAHGRTTTQRLAGTPTHGVAAAPAPWSPRPPSRRRRCVPSSAAASRSKSSCGSREFAPRSSFCDFSKAVERPSIAHYAQSVGDDAHVG